MSYEVIFKRAALLVGSEVHIFTLSQSNNCFPKPSALEVKMASPDNMDVSWKIPNEGDVIREKLERIAEGYEDGALTDSYQHLPAAVAYSRFRKMVVGAGARDPGKSLKFEPLHKHGLPKGTYRAEEVASMLKAIPEKERPQTYVKTGSGFACRNGGRRVIATTDELGRLTLFSFRPRSSRRGVYISPGEEVTILR